MCCRYLLSSRWFGLWKRYVGYDRWDVSGVGDPNLFPGPIDNACLLNGEYGPVWPGPPGAEGLRGAPQATVAAGREGV